MALTADAKDSESIAKDLLTVQAAVKSSREFRSLLASPIVSKEKKKAIVTEVFRKKIGDVARDYLSAIIDKRREDILSEILAEYFLLRDEQLGIVSVDVKTTIEFSAAQERSLTKQLESYTQKKVRVSFSLDKMLKGGFIAKVGDTMLDGSIRRQLEILRARLKDGSTSKN